MNLFLIQLICIIIVLPVLLFVVKLNVNIRYLFLHYVKKNTSVTAIILFEIFKLYTYLFAHSSKAL